MPAVRQIDRSSKWPPASYRHQMIDVMPAEAGSQRLRSGDQLILGGRNRANKVCAIHKPTLTAPPINHQPCG